MNSLSPALWAQIQATEKFDVTRLSMMTEWWHWMLLVAVSVAVPAAVIWMYIRDTRELAPPVALALGGLRVFALLGLLLTFLGLEQRTEQKMLQNSRLVVLIDASQSMGLQDAESSADPGASRRIDLVADELQQGKLLGNLRDKHDVVVMRFDEGEQPIELASYTKLAVDEQDVAIEENGGLTASTDALERARILFAVAAGLMLIGVPMILWYSFSGNAASMAPSYALLLGVCLLATGAIMAAVTNLAHVDLSFAQVLGAETEGAKSIAEPEAGAAEEELENTNPQEVEIDWLTELTPGGNETRLGEALITVVNRQRGGPIAGILLVSDGQGNSGLPYGDAVLLANEAQIPVFTVGIGSSRRPTNVELADIEAPARVYPGDRFTITGYVQSFGMGERRVKVELYSYPHGQDQANRQTVPEDETYVVLSATGALQPIKFEIEPDEEPGKRVYVMQVEPPSGERNVTDNRREITVQIVERRAKVLLLAGGPTREYRFLRNQLYRDKETIVHVLLQSARLGTAQEADKILDEFPTDEDDLFEYDAIIAFDPDWESIDEAGIQLLEEWVSRQAGGLVVVAGPVFTPKWAGKRRGELAISLLKGLYPVQFYNWGTSQGLGRFGADQTSRLEFTRAGLESEFLWLGETASKSQDAWAGFEGVYGYYAVKDVKPGATVYAHFVNDEEALAPDDMPVFMAAHYYGAGRVFFLGSGEMWRIRQVDDSYFETYYTKLIRHVTAGRLQRDSKRGVLLVERARYKLGDAINIQARLMDAQHRPLSVDETPKVDAIISQPDGRQVTVPLGNVNLGGEAIAGREGMYAGQFTALQLGDYNVQLTVPGTAGEEVLTQQIVVRAPRKEIERPELNQALLVDLADRTGGQYFHGMHVAAGRDANVGGLANEILPRDRLTPLPEVPNTRFDRQLMTWLLALVAGALCLEWFIRRVSKLA